MKNAVSAHRGIDWKGFSPALLLVVNSLIWFTLIHATFTNSVSNLVPSYPKEILFGVYYSSVALSVVVGGTLMVRARRKGLALWMAFGAVTSVLMAIFPSNDLPLNVAISILLGVSIGIGLPSTLAYFADATKTEKRGFLGGTTWSAVGFGILAVAAIFISAGPQIGIELLSVWRLVGFFLFVFLSSRGRAVNPAAPVQSFRQILSRRELLLYLLPWIMFCLVNFTQLPISTKLFGDFANISGFIEFAITGVFALLGGFFADRVGRKRIVIMGFVLLGIEYAILSLFNSNPISWYIFTSFDGAAWGMFAAVFFMTIWGDLAGTYNKEKYYIIGGLPYFLSGFLSTVIGPYIEQIDPSMKSIPALAFSLASFFLFIAVLPLIYAPETLPEKVMKDRDLKSYVNKALEKVKKETESGKQDQGHEQEEKSEEKEEQKGGEFEEAQKLAEKYY